MHHVRHHIIDKQHPLYAICKSQCHASNNLHNAVRFRQRNIMTGLQKDPNERHEHERTVIAELEMGIKYYNTHAKVKKDGSRKVKDMLDAEHWYADYEILDAIMKATDSPDYRCSAITAQTAQMILKNVDASWASSIAAIKDYAANPSKYTGKPNLAGYCHKGGLSTVIINNQDAVIYERKRPEQKKGDKKQKFKPGWELKLPKAGKTRLNLGRKRPEGKLVEVRIVPDHNCFDIQIVMDDGKETHEPLPMNRVACGDPGVNNFVSFITNCGVTPLIYNGRPLKSANQWYNKEMARIQSEQTKGGDEKFVMTEEAQRLSQHRNYYVRDYLLKVSKQVVAWCVENRIDTLMIGHNKGWKQEINIGHVNNQKFVQIPFSQLIDYLESRCLEAGIRFMTVEESYTSKACFDAGDYIPTYGNEKPEGGFIFSGYRSPTTTYYRRNDETGALEPYKVQPRGLYRVNAEEPYDVNSDLNGAANTLRKAWPGAFKGEGRCEPDLRGGVRIIIHPDYESSNTNRKRQLEENKKRGKSKSSQRRQARKQAKIVVQEESSPTGVELCE